MHVSPIIKTENLGTLLEFSEKNTLFISDITNTLYRPCNTMSDKKWRTYMANHIRGIIPDTTQALKIANRIENKIVNQVDKQLVHNNAPKVIGELQKQEIPFLAITMKSWAAPYDPNFGITTSQHLKKLGIDLEKSVPLLGNIETDKTEEYTFAKGIIFTNKKPLNASLNAFLNRMEKKPEKIIILENSITHKEKLEAVIKAHNIAITYVLHSSSDEQTIFDPDLGTIEFIEYMNNSKLILDKEANEIKNKNPSVNYGDLLTQYILNEGFVC